MDTSDILKTQYVGTCLQFGPWWGQRRSVTKDIRTLMAQAVGADTDSVSASKAIYNPKACKSLKEIISLRGAMVDAWCNRTNPYPQDSTRLLHRDRIAEIESLFGPYGEFAKKLRKAAEAVQEDRATIMQEAQQRLQLAFDPANYPPDLRSMFHFTFTYPEIGTPSSGLPKEVYDQQLAIFNARMQEAASLSAQGLMEEFHELLNTFANQLAPAADGQKKRFHGKIIEKCQGFAEKFKSLYLGNHTDLNQAVAQLEALVQGLDPQEVKKTPELKAEIASTVAQIQSAVAPHIIKTPRRAFVSVQKAATQPEETTQPQPEPLPEMADVA